MEARIIDLPLKINDIFKALERNEKVKIFYRGKIKEILKNVAKITQTRSVCDHPFFNSLNNDESVEEQMNRIRGGRYHDI